MSTQMPRSWSLAITLLLLGLLHGAVLPLFGQCPAELTPSPTSSAAVGIAVDLGDDVAIVGAAYGYASVFRFDGVEWQEEEQLTPSDGDGAGRFGAAVAIEGEVAVVGAWRDAQFGVRAGAAYVYRFDGVEWQEEQKLVSGTVRSYFGRSVDVSGNRILIGAAETDASMPHRPAAYLYAFNGVAWGLEQILLGSDIVPSSESIGPVSLLGETAIVGAPRATGVVEDSGAVFVFNRVGTSWVEVDKLFDADGSAYDYFGASVDLSGETLIIGALADEEADAEYNASYNLGSAHLFRFVAGSWIAEQKLLPLAPQRLLGFGQLVGIDGDVATVGSGNGPDVEIWRFDGAQWNPDGVLFADSLEWSRRATDVRGDRVLTTASIESAHVYSYEGGVWELAAVSEHPESQAGCPGDEVTLSVTVMGEPPFSYQWQYAFNTFTDFVDLPGATNSTLVFDPVTEDDHGFYQVVVTTECGVRTSTMASVHCHFFLRGTPTAMVRLTRSLMHSTCWLVRFPRAALPLVLQQPTSMVMVVPMEFWMGCIS